MVFIKPLIKSLKLSGKNIFGTNSLAKIGVNANMYFGFLLNSVLDSIGFDIL